MAPVTARTLTIAPTPPVREPLLRDLIGDSLRRTRLRQGRTLRDVAAASRVSLAYLSEVERGRKEPSSEVLAAVSAALHIRLLDLVSDVRHDLDRATAGRRRTAITSRPVPVESVASGGDPVALAA